MRNTWGSLIIGILLAGMVRADMGPIMYDGYTLTTRENSDIRMKSEEVNIYWGDRIRVVAMFEMQNDANKPIEVSVGFPVELQDAAIYHRDPITGARIKPPDSERPVYDFRVTINEKDKPVEIKEAHQEKPPRTWSGWTQTFPPGRTVVRVEYHIEPFTVRFGNGLCEDLCYVMDTGALWKGTIGQADIKVHFAEPVVSEQIREGTWPREWWIDGNDLCWRFKDYEPTWKDNIQIDYVPPGVYHEIQRLRKAINQNPQDEKRIVELARCCFALYEVRPLGYETPGVLSYPEYDRLLARITDPNDKADFIKAWADSNEVPVYDRKSHSHYATSYTEETRPRQYQAARVRSRQAVPDYRIHHILSSAGYLPEDERSEFVTQAKEMLEQLLAKNPKNADAWLEYLSNCHLFVHGAYSPKVRWLYWCPTPPKQKQIVERAYAQCPTNEGIKAWHDFVTSSGANADTRLLPDAETGQLSWHLSNVGPSR